jgi:O-methyltransferase
MQNDVLIADYLDLLKKALSASIYDQSRWKQIPDTRKRVLQHVTRWLHGKGLLVVDPKAFSAEDIQTGNAWTTLGFTMVGHLRMDNVQACIEDVLARNVPGDLVETGVWKGGVTILMRAVLKAHGVTDRLVWAADSFEGLPVPKDADDGADLSQVAELKISLDQVQEHFRRFGLLDDQVRFLKGWFADTLPDAPIERIAVLRLDGDLYSSTMDALQALYDRVSPGGYIIVDDYHSWDSCKRAIHDFLDARGLQPEIKTIDWTGAYWQVPEPR